VGGDGPPVLLLHGYPQTHLMWRGVAPALAERFTVVCPDLRGYGDSARPPSDDTHTAYSKRTMAEDQRALMSDLGFDRFRLAGHDRGARVARRLALDHPESVERLAVLDIVPTAVIYASLDRERAMEVWRYMFLTRPADLPERLIGADPAFYLRWTFDEWAGSTSALTQDARAEYLRCFDEASIRATCEDYRAGAGIDLVHDAEDADRRIARPVLILWSRAGLGSSWDVPAIWREEAADVRGRALDCGHFIAEECPGETARELIAFFAADEAAGPPS
jgi:haloacetate dehalogenase